MTTPILHLPPLPPVSAVMPERYAPRAMLVAAYGQEIGRGDEGRVGLVLAAAIGLCWSDGRLPRFSLAHDRIITYGATVLDHLLGIHRVPVSATLWSTGGSLLDWISATLPTEAEVEDLANFTSPNEGASTGR